MTPDSDRGQEMYEPSAIDEATADLVLERRAVDSVQDDAALGSVVDFVERLHATVTHPPAPVSPALAAILRDGLPTPPVVAPAERRERRPTRLRRMVAGGAVAFGLAATGVAGAAAANLLPDGPQRVVAAVVKALTPFEVPTPEPAEITPPRPTTGTPGTARGPGAEQPGQAGTNDPSVPGPAGAGTETTPAPGGPSSSPPAGTAGTGGSTPLSPSTTVSSGSGGVLPPTPRPSLPPTTTPEATTPSVPITPPTVPTPTTPPTTLPTVPVR